ncbi:hypothetical protein QMK19_39345 [Streptomyces sp. H10-C2]|uniref:hypothetical protein n=1 Tax=Streptomyces sp. H10-C2 TaxID=3046210 RepID=UPI0024BB420F|nr:hypothetical protein [Streptomyces sp. H10-C2]MDJ0375485.1 hypothetical protein [Streptomyces sp. H10-C2]
MTDGRVDGTATGATTDATVPTARTSTEDTPTTPGGIPGIPALTIGTTSTITAVSSVGLAAGPGAAVLLAGGLAATAAVTAVIRAPRTTASGTTRNTKQTGGTRANGRAQAPRPSALGRLTGNRSGAGRTGGAHRAGNRTGGLSSTGGRRGVGAALRSGAGSGVKAARAAQTRAGQIKSVRSASAAAPVSRRQRREQLTGDRRKVADARREARAGARAERRAARRGNGATGPQKAAGGALKGRGGSVAARVGRAAGALRPGGGSGSGKRRQEQGKQGPGKSTDTAKTGWLPRRRQAMRQARDTIRARQVAAKQAHIEKRAREKSRKSALRRSAARFKARRVLSALLASPLGMLSLLMWLPAKLFRIAPPRWGRRLYRHLTQAATDARLRRDVAAYDAHDQAEAEAAAQNRERLAPTDRATDAQPDTKTLTVQEDAMTTNAFDFRAAAEDMLNQAQTAEPGGMMNVLAAFESLPEAIGLIAETFAVVAGRCSEDMPLEPPVGDAIMDLHKQLIAAVDTASQVSQTFQTIHEADIRRHAEPRPGEEQWDTSANQD